MLTSARHIEQTEVVAGNNEAWRSEPPSLLSDASQACSSVDVTNSTVDDSCAGFDFDVSYSGTLSDLNSGPYRLSSNAYARDDDDDDLEEEPEPGSGVSAELLKEYAELGTPMSSRGVKAWGGSYRGHPDDFAKPAAAKPRPNSMLEWMMELQSSAEEAYITAKANEEIMKRSMR